MGFYSKIPYSYKEDECLVIVLIEIYNLVKTKTYINCRITLNIYAQYIIKQGSKI